MRAMTLEREGGRRTEMTLRVPHFLTCHLHDDAEPASGTVVRSESGGQGRLLGWTRGGCWEGQGTVVGKDQAAAEWMT